MGRLLKISMLLLLACATFAQTSTLSNPYSDGVVWQPPAYSPAFVKRLETLRPSIPKEMISTLLLSGFRVILERTEMEDVRASLGGVIGRRGDGGESVQWLCYYVTGPNGRWGLWLDSGEIDGGRVGGFWWQQLTNNVAFDERCRMLGQAKVELPIGLQLRTAESDVLKTLGRPTARFGDALIYQHEHRLTIRNEPFTSENSIVVVLRAGRVWTVQVSKTTAS
jgi:hypothetical protein